jgi:ADP-dependent NAD(P)H-hydrate dehydratase / NAD(P)H-hydrate epimerase
VGGDHGFGGAALMAAEAAARTGAGLISVATHPDHIPAFLARRPELMVHGIEQAEELSALLPKASVIVIGPGLGQTDWSKLCLKLVLAAQTASKVPLVIDADALNLISQGYCKEYIATLENWILTPHTGEAARLLACTREEIQSDRTLAMEKLQAKFGGVCILKGAGCLIGYQTGNRLHIDLCKEGNPGMATGGMGDILSGVLGAFLAQHFSLKDSARIGVCVHAKSADLVASKKGERGLIATDLLPFIQQLMNPNDSK